VLVKKKGCQGVESIVFSDEPRSWAVEELPGRGSEGEGGGILKT